VITEDDEQTTTANSLENGERENNINWYEQKDRNFS
jgi:hypothetical protein